MSQIRNEKSVCCKNKGCVKSHLFIVFVVLFCTYMQTDIFVCGQSVKGIHDNYRRNVGELSKLPSETTDTLSGKIMSKIRKRNKHTIVKKSSSLANSVDSHEPSLMPFYSNMFYEEKSEPSPSTVSPFGK